MSLKSVFGNARESLSILLKKKNIIWMGISIELLFFFILGFFAGPLQEGIFNNLLQLGDLVIQESDITNDIFSVITSSNYFKNLLVLLAILFVLVYFFYGWFQGYLWRFSFNLIKRDQYKQFIIKFYKINILWYPLFCIFILINFSFFYFDTLAKRVDETAISFEPVTYLLVFIIAYFALPSYAYLTTYPPWKSIKLSIKNAKNVLDNVYLLFIIAIPFILIHLILKGIDKAIINDTISLTITLVVGLVTIMPLLIWARLTVLKSIIK